jgi:hypothetical protein
MFPSFFAFSMPFLTIQQAVCINVKAINETGSKSISKLKQNSILNLHVMKRTRTLKRYCIKKIVWLESASELCRPSDSRLSAKLVPTFVVRGASRGQYDGSLQPYSRLSRPEPLLFLPSSSSVVLTRLSGPHSRPTTSQKIWKRRESTPDL